MEPFPQALQMEIMTTVGAGVHVCIEANGACAVGLDSGDDRIWRLLFLPVHGLQ